MTVDKQTYKLTDAGSLPRIPLILGVLGIAVTAGGFAANREQFFFSWLNAYVFWLSLGLGALFFVMMHNLTGSVWGIVVRRIAETLASTIPVMAVLFIPLLLGLHQLFHWSHPEAVAADRILQSKAPYLNQTFFIVRAVIYFGVWFILSWILHRGSVRQDSGFDPARQRKIQAASAVGIIAFAFTITFAAFDWLMSLDAHWYSTIYGVGFFAGSVMGMLALTILLVMYLQRRGALTGEITVEHRHDLAKLLFAFIILWAYMAFSQYFLIWYASIPEETIWYHHCWEGSWRIVSLLMAVGHFGLPFVLLMSRPAKRGKTLLGVMCVWLLAMHWLDLYWNIMPNLHHHGVQISWMDLSATVGIGGIFLWKFWATFKAHAVIPVNDPKLKASLAHVNTF